MPKALGVPEVTIGRSALPREFRQLTSFNNGDLIPLLVEPVQPGDSISMPIKALIRMQTPLYPVMDNMFADITAWYVPDRLVWSHFKEFWGENNQTYWEQPTPYETPQIVSPVGGWDTGSLADYMGLPTKVGGYSVSHLPFRAYCMVWNEFFRDENLKEPIFFNKDETTLTGINHHVDPDDDDYTTDIQLGAYPAKVARVASYESKALPEPQKGPDVPLFNAQGIIPVITGDDHISGRFTTIGKQDPLMFSNVDCAEAHQIIAPTVEGQFDFANLQVINPFAQTEEDVLRLYHGTTSSHNAEIDDDRYLIPSNLWASIGDAAVGTVRELRLAVQLQKYYERIATCGSRYIEVLAGIFGVKSSDARLQRPEFLGGHRYRINMTQVLANTEATNQKIGSTGGMSQTIINDYLFTHSFEEHGTLLILACTRTEHCLQQGIPRFWLRKKQFDYYNKLLDHIGEQPVYNAEIFATGNVEGSKDMEAFGYQPAFEDMRLGRKTISGEMRSNATASLDSWHYGDDYSELPTLSSKWIDEPTANVDRTLSVTSAVSNQLFGDFVFESVWTRGMSMYGQPGFMDHF